jgi:putative nucleotidyltransferase with HDIG domain
VRVEDAGVGMVLIKDVVDERGNLLLEKGISLTRNYISRLKRLGIVNINVTDPYAASLKENQIINQQLRTELADCFTELFKMKAADILNFQPPAAHIEKLNNVVTEVIEEAESQLDQMLNIQVRQPSADETEHAVNVCLLSTVTGLYLKFDKGVLRDLALGALLHDLGKSMLPHGEQDIAYLHTIYGRELLLRSNVSNVVSRIAAEHHEFFDGSGQPKGLAGRDIHPLSRLVTIADYYDNAMNATSRPRLEIIETLMDGSNTLYDLNLLRAFLNTIAVFSVGSLVRLNTGKTGYIVGNRVHFPLRPTVRVLDDYGHVDIDLVMKPNISITELIAE